MLGISRFPYMAWALFALSSHTSYQTNLKIKKRAVSGVVVGAPLLEQCATRMLSRWARASHEEIAIGLNLRMVPLILASRTPLPSPLSPFFEFPSYLLLYTSNTAPVPNTRSDPELFCFKKILTNFSSI